MANVVEAAGFALILVGLWVLWPPLALIAGGVLLVAVAQMLN